jgi:hypothetical protein
MNSPETDFLFGAEPNKTIEVPFDRMTEFYCSPEWHIMRLGSAVDASLALYSLAYRVTRACKGKYRGSVPQLMHHFGRSESTFRRAYANLRNLGFFSLIKSGKENWEANVFQVLTHEDWAEAHPNRCAVKLDNNWHSGFDPLSVELFDIADGKIKFRPFQIGWYRQNDLTDEEIVLLFADWYPPHAIQHGKKWREGVGYQFGRFVALVGKACHEDPHDRDTILKNARMGAALTEGLFV